MSPAYGMQSEGVEPVSEPSVLPSHTASSSTLPQSVVETVITELAEPPRAPPLEAMPDIQAASPTSMGESLSGLAAAGLRRPSRTMSQSHTSGGRYRQGADWASAVDTSPPAEQVIDGRAIPVTRVSNGGVGGPGTGVSHQRDDWQSDLLERASGGIQERAAKDQVRPVPLASSAA